MRFPTPADGLGAPQTRLVDFVDSLLGRGVVLRGELCGPWPPLAFADLPPFAEPPR